MPYAASYREDWKASATYVDHGGDEQGRHFFQRWYDEPRLESLAAAVPSLELLGRRVVRMQPNWNDWYVRAFPLLLPLGPVFGLLGRERVGDGGDVVRLTFVRR